MGDRRPDGNGTGRGTARAAAYLREAVRRIVRRFRPEQIILFGSHARGRPEAGSDIDLLVVLRSRQHPFEREVAMDELLADRPVPMDVLVRTPDEMETYRRGFYPFWKEVLERGKTLYATRR